MGHLFELSASLKDSLVVLPVNSESRERIQKVWTNNPNLKKLPLFTLYGDTILKKLFPHQLFPHLVWIDQEGKYLGTTDAEYANKEYVRAIYNGTKSIGKLKSDTDLFNPQEISLQQYFKADSSRHFFPYLSELKRQSRIFLQADSSIRYYAINTQMVTFYAIATASQGMAYEPKRRKINIPNIKTFEYQKDYGYQADWDAENAFSYERVFPKGTTTAQIYAQLLQDLNAHFKLEGKMENTSSPVLALRQIEKPNEDARLTAPSIKLSNWIYQINKIPGLDWVINQTQLNPQTLMPALPKEPTLEAIQQSLKSFGLQLQPAEETLPTFHLNPTDKL